MYSSNGVSFNGGDTGRLALSKMRQFQRLDAVQGKQRVWASYRICHIVVIADCDVAEIVASIAKA